MSTPLHSHPIRPVAWALLGLWLASSAPAQYVRPVTGIMAHYDDVNNTNGNYSVRGAGSGEFPTGTVYNMTFNTGGEQNNLYITGFESGTNVFRFIQLASRINIVRQNGAVTGKHHIVFFEESSVSGTNVNLKPSLVTTMENSLRSDMVNRGADNVFANQGDGNGNNNNIERIDYIFSSGFPYYNLTDRRGFVVMDRGGNDRFKIAVILSLDTNGMPATFSRPVSVSDTNWGPSGITLETTVMRGYTENGAPLRPSARTSVQSLSGVFLSWDEFGLTTNDMIHGYSLAGNDTTTNHAYWLQTTNPVYFPTNTTVESQYGGLDLISGGAMFFDETLDVGLGDRIWQDWNGDGIQDANEPGLSNVLVHIYNESNILVATARSEADGQYFRQGIGPGTYTVQFYAPEGYTFSPQYARTEPELDSDPDPVTGITDPIVMLVGLTNLTIDAGLYPTPGDLRLSKTVSSTNVNIGDPVVYTLVITNAGVPFVSYIQVTDALPSAFNYSGHGATTGSFSSATGIWEVGNLAAGAAATLTITGTVAAGSGGSVVTNIASITQMDRPDINAADNTAAAVFRVQLADLSVNKETDRLAQEEGTPILFTITVTNQGPDEATGIRINDSLPSGFTFAGWYASQGVYSNATGVWHLGALTNGGSAVLEIEASAAAGSGGFYFTNTASVGYSSHEDPDAADNSDSVVVLVYGADISIEKSVNPPAAAEGQVVTYTLVVTNPGPSRAPAILVSEPLTNGLTYVSHTASQGTYSNATGIWSLGALEVDSAATLQIQAMAGPGTKDTSITNRAAITATGLPDPFISNNTATAVLRVSSLVLTKASDVVNSVHPGDTITYTIVASNSGSLTHADVTLSDLVPDGTTYVPDSLEVVQTPSISTTEVYTSSTTFTAPPGVTSVTVEAWGGGGGGGRARGYPATGGGGAGGSYAMKVVAVVPGSNYTVMVGAGGIGGNGTGTDTQHGRDGSNSWFHTTNTVFAQGGARGLSDANVNYANGAAGSGSSALCIGDTVYAGGSGSRGVYTSGSGYSGAGGGGAGTTGAGGNASSGTGGSGTSLYGGDGADGVGNSTAGGNGSTYGGGGSGGKANSTTDRNGGSGANGLVRITYAGASGEIDAPPDLASGWSLVPGQTLQATFQVLVDDPLALMAITNTATAVSAQLGVPVSATVVDRVIHTDLGIAKVASVSSLRENESLVFTLTVTNQSAEEIATGVAVGDLLPTGFTFASSIPSQGAYNPTTGVWTVGTVNPSASATLAITATAAAGSGGLYWTNTAAITACNEVDPVLSDNTASAVVLVQGADLALAKTVDNPTPNETSQIVYTLRLTNSGPSDVTGVTVSEPLTNGLTYVSHSASQGSYNSGSGVWTVGAVAADGTATLSITATVQTNTFGASITNRCRISAASLPDPVSANNQAEATIVVSGLRVSKTSNVSGFARPGDVIAYTITVSNLSTVAHTGLRLEDVLPTGTVYVAGSLNVSVSPANPATNVLFTNTATFVVPAGVTSLTVEAWGGGGGGGAALGNPATGGGGAGGSYALKTIPVVPAQSYTVTVGAGGAGGTTATTNGVAGGASWFSTTNTVFAQGGARGMGTSANSNNAAGGTGSSALCVGDTVYRGGNGSTGLYLSGSSYYSGGGGGGAGSTGNGGNAAYGTGGSGASVNGGNGANGVTNNQTGANGATHGGGGSGGKANSSTDRSGGAGAGGLIQITYSPRGATNVPPNLASNWTLAAGGTLTATFNATVVNPGSTTQLLNTVSVTCDQQPTPVVAAVADRVVHTDLGLTKTVNDNHPEEGDTVVYTLVVTNLGPNNATNILVTDPLTNGLIYVSHTAGAGTYNRTTGVWSVSTLAIGATAQLQISAQVATNTAGTVITNQAWISGAGAADLALENNQASAEITVVGVDIGVGKSASSGMPVENSLLIYTVSVTNFGPDIATGVAVTDVLPTNVTYVSHLAGQGTYDPGSGVWTVGTLAAMETATLDISATVKTNTAGRATTNTASLTAVDQVDVRATNNVARVVVTPTTALLGLVKTASPAGPVYAGDIISYTLVATNRSAVTQTNVTVTDPLPTGAVYVANSCQVTAPVTVNETFADYFSRRVYSNNDGTETWAGDWVEGENNGPTAGFIQIQFDNGVDETYTLRYSGGSQSIRRTADLSRYTAATLEFDYQRIGLEAGEYVALHISSNGPSGPWTELARFQGAATDSDYTHYSQNISSYLSATTVIRFSSPAGMDGTDIVWIDNLVITGTRRAMQTAPGGAPPNLTSGQTLQTGESLTIRFDVWVANPALYAQIVNVASLTSAQTPTPQVATAITPVETCFTAAPTGLYADPTNITSFTAHWTEVPGAFGYRLDVSTDPAFASTVSGYSNRAVAGTFQAVTGLVHDATYYFRVRAEWDALCTSANSATQTVTTLDLPSIWIIPETLDFGVVQVNDFSNLVLVVTNSSGATLDIDSIEFTGTGSTEFSVLPATASIPPFSSVELTVTFAPTAHRTNVLVMTIFNTAIDHPELPVPVRGVGFDPTALPPEVLDYRLTDATALTNQVVDRSLAEGTALVEFTVHHATGVTLDGATFDLIYPDGSTAFNDAAFSTLTATTFNGRDCQKLSATVPRFFPAALGVYTARVTVASSNGVWLTDETRFASVVSIADPAGLLDNFNRTDAIDNIGSNWMPVVTGPVPGNVQVRNRVLQFFGVGGTGGTNGRISIVRDLSGRYDTVFTNNAGTLVWAFNFYSGRTNQLGLAPGAYGAAFVLGSDATNWVAGAGNGYAVRIGSNQVALASFSGGLNLDSDLTGIGPAASLNSATSSVAVKVELDAASGVWRLYVRELPGSGIGAFGDPISGMEGYLVAQATNTFHLHRSLPYAGCYWNHGNAAVQANTAAFFDDLYAYVKPETAPMVASAIDNDIMLPTSLGAVLVNGEPVPDEVPDRFEVVWTNAPEFIVTFDPLASDQDPGYPTPYYQREVRGIGEYRVTSEAVNGFSASNRALLGLPFPVVTTNGALANYGFEIIPSGGDWILDNHCSIQTRANNESLVHEGTNSLRQTTGGTAYQVFEFRNAAGVTPRVTMSGWVRGGSAELKIAAYSTNDPVNPVGTATVSSVQAPDWTSFSLPEQDLGNGTVEILKVTLTASGGETYWDNLRFSVDIGTNRPSMRFRAGAANQGLVPQYLFGVDADYNRRGDRLAGTTKYFYIPFDMTPPTPVNMPAGGTGASTETVDDPTTQFDLEWSTSGLGPDDPYSAVHPTKIPGDIDLMSRWHSYKIYYGPYDPQNVPPDDNPNSTDGYIYKTYIQNGAYRSWKHVTPTNTIADPAAPNYQSNYLALTNLATSRIRLYDLDYDQDYVVVVVGVDAAGNEGNVGLQSWATNNTIKFAMIGSRIIPKDEAQAAFPQADLGNTNTATAAALNWIASGQTNTQGGYTSVWKDYDLIHWDSGRFQESSNNQWKLVGTVRTNWFVDDGGQFRDRGQIRFYRASYKDRWKRTNAWGQVQRPVASEEVYALHNVVLSGGQNFVALHGLPNSNTLQSVFGGLETFPGGGSALPASGSTLLEFYDSGTNASATLQYYLNSNGRWMQVGGEDVTTTAQESNFFTRGFSITLPDPLPTNYVSTTALDINRLDQSGNPLQVPAMIWSPVLQVPTNGFSQTIYTGNRSGRGATLVYNVAALRLPVSAHPSEMNLLYSGFVNGPRGSGDEIYTMNTATKGVLSGSTIYCDENGVWRFVASNNLVPGGFFKPNDVLVIVSRNGGIGNSWTWTYQPTDFYNLPTRWMGQ